MALDFEIEKLKFDKRLLDWHLSRGHLSKEEMRKHLEALPDLSANVENFTLVDDEGSSSSDSHHDALS